MRSPVDVDLKPGNYLVVAALDDGRFHEVFRKVPKNPQSAQAVYNHQRWTIKEDGVVLPEIKIPEFTVSEGMAIILPDAAAAGRSPSGFHMDVREFTVDDYRKCSRQMPGDRRRIERPDNFAITVHFDRAVHTAEKVGKRLPTATEFERAAAIGNPQACTQDDLIREHDFGPTGLPECDRVGDGTPIAGLFSNVAEWTSSVLQSPPDDAAPLVLELQFTSLFRVVKGGDMTVVQGNATCAPEHRRPSDGYSVRRHDVHPGLGFRCVRSLQPRFLPDE